ncbi:MAG: CoA-binding protein [Chloroflexi bacterium]|nr:CoA-binding protein [Chloroflexota bacterium]
MNKEVLDGLFKPKSVAVIGASATPGKIGYSVIKSLINGGYEGPIYPINLKADEILGIKAYPTVFDVPGKIDLAVITIPAKFVLTAIEDCGKAGVKGLSVITSGFGEVGDHETEAKLVEMAHKYGMRMIGPNIIGTLSNSDKLNASFANILPLPGEASLISQSGALLIALDEATHLRGVGFDKLFSLGNMADIDFADIIEWLADDENTKCIALYIEGLKEGRRFLDVCKKVNKPVIALKAGVSAHGAAAAASHTGSLAGAAKVYGSAFEQAGIIQAANLDNLFDLTMAFELQPPMKGDNLLIVTNGGGVGVLATDSAERYGIPLKFLPDDLQKEFKNYMPDFGSAKNPVDITGGAGLEGYKKSIEFGLKQDWVDGLAVLYCETAVTDPDEIAKGIYAAIQSAGDVIKHKPVAVSFVGGDRCAKAMRWLTDNGIPAYDDPDRAVNVLGGLRQYARMQEEKAHEHDGAEIKGDYARAVKIIENARADNRDSLTEVEAKEVFEAYGLDVTKTLLAKSEQEAVDLANKIGYPIVMKIVSPDILHKSDAGGVKVNIKDDAMTREWYNIIMKNAKAYKADANIHGVAIQEMAPLGTEVILGSINDASFGPTVMFGLGGIFVEVLKDVVFAVTPVSEGQAMKMQDSIRSKQILKGARGEKPRDQKAMANLIAHYSKMILDLRDEIKESDANPVMLYEDGKGLKVVDARIILKDK